jgi:nicotinamidase-related amidase
MTTTAKTLFQLANAVPAPARLGLAPLVLIDYQNVYLAGPLALSGAAEAVERAAVLLAAARERGSKVIHVAHKGAPGGGFDRAAHSGAIIDALRPIAGEVVVEKPRPNAFSGTDLAEHLAGLGSELIIAGFMTHNCVSSTARAAKDLGYITTIVADASATRDLPLGDRVIPAKVLHEAELAGLGDHHGVILNVADLV